MDVHLGIRVVILVTVLSSLIAAAYSDDDDHLESFKNSPRVNIRSRDSEALWVIKRLIKREAIKHNRYQYLVDRHMNLIHSRRKRGWVAEDAINKATIIPNSTTTTGTSPPINPDLLTTTKQTTITDQKTASSQQTTPTQHMTYKVQTTTESSSASVFLPLLKRQEVAIMLITILFRLIL